MKDLYDMIFKRKSMRKFDVTLALTEDELREVKQETEKLIPLVNEFNRTLITQENSSLELLEIAAYSIK
ncbi:MAG: hypothetical protein ACOY46_09500 [Bacillota bacterium]